MDEYSANIREIIHSLARVEEGDRSDSKPPAVLIITPPVLDEYRFHQFSKERWNNPDLEKSRLNSVTAQYAAASFSTAKQLQEELSGVIPVLPIDLHSIMRQSNRPELLNDGLHLSLEGNQFVGELLKREIANHFPALLPDQLSFGGGSFPRRSLSFHIDSYHFDLNRFRILGRCDERKSLTNRKTREGKKECIAQTRVLIFTENINRFEIGGLRQRDIFEGQIREAETKTL